MKKAIKYKINSHYYTIKSSAHWCTDFQSNIDQNIALTIL